MYIFRIVEKSSGVIHKTKNNKNGVYFSLKDAKVAVKNSVRYKNKKLRSRKIIETRNDQTKFDDYSIIEYDLIEKERHIV